MLSPFKLNRMRPISASLLLRRDDYEVILSYIKGGQAIHTYDRRNVRELEGELRKAKLIPKEEFPSGIARLNSKITIQEKATGKIMELILVTPNKANISTGKISIMAPLGTALIGSMEGQEIQWQVPGGVKTFTILEVDQTE
jgi:regulator of nucleoside diphosphate kinase